MLSATATDQLSSAIGKPRSLKLRRLRLNEAAHRERANAGARLHGRSHKEFMRLISQNESWEAHLKMDLQIEMASCSRISAIVADVQMVEARQPQSPQFRGREAGNRSSGYCRAV